MRECKCKETGKKYAVKIFRSEDEEMFIHAEREYKIMLKLYGHPNIVEGVDYIPELLRCRGYLVMEKIEGQSIISLVTENGPIPEPKAKILMK